MTNAAPASKKLIWVGRILSTVCVLTFVSSGVMKLLKSDEIIKEFTRLGYGENLIWGIGILELACVALYAIPRTAVLGAILLTGYLGGATATHLRIGDQFISPVILGVLVWGGLFFCDLRLRALIPLRS